jgi:quercetin dioxygenase-like cupin family protein
MLIMKHIHFLDAEAEEVTEAGAHGIKLRTLIGEKDGAPNFYMRIISLEAGVESPDHSHPWEQENFIISGKGTLEVEGKTVNLRPGDATFIPPNAHHHFQATEPIEML